MKLAIHYRPGSYSDRWITYCTEKLIPYKLVSCYDSDIIEQLADCNGLLWHWTTSDYKAALFARQLILSLEKKKFRVFPDVNSSWHYDDKVGQKYLLEAINAPFIKSYVFYSKQEAINWVNKATFPKVFKLRNGASSSNVKLIKNKQIAKQIINKAFKSGFSRAEPINRLKQRFWILKKDKNKASLKKFINGIGRMFIMPEGEILRNKEKGYVFFQDFIAGNTYDTRVVVIGDKCFGARRYCRPGDFRASGSGLFTYDPALMNMEMVRISFDVAKRLDTQSLAFDFILDKGKPKIIEISYCFAIECCDDAPGFWDSSLNWHDENVNLQKYIIEDFIKSLSKRTSRTEKIAI